MSSRALQKVSPIETTGRKQHKEKKVRYFDYGLLAMIILILAFGLVMLYSTSAYSASVLYDDPAHFLKRQAAAAALGFAALIVISHIPYQFYAKIHGLIYVVALGMCIAVSFVGTDMDTGSRRWFKVGSITFQPSEFAKIAIIITMAAIIANGVKTLRSWKKVVVAFIMVLPLFASIAITNLSTAVIVMGIAYVMLFVASKPKGIFLIIAGTGVLGIIFFILRAGYRGGRVAMWLHPEDYPNADVYQTLQGLYAIGAGGLFGKGLGGSVQKLGVLPVAQNDMIFAIICEELGIFGAVCVILLYLIMFWRLLYIANHARDLMGSYLVIGIMVHFALQVIMNIAVVTNSIPNTGVILPLISYGGTSVMLLLAELGIALSVSRQIPME